MSAPDHDPIAERAAALVEEFALFDDWMDRYAHLVEMGRALPPLDDAYKTDAYRVRGCQSQVWLRSFREATPEGARLRFEADSDALVTKGLAAVLVRVLDRQPPAAVAAADLSFLDAIGLREHLSPSRANGLAAMAARMRAAAQSEA
ncbi:MAG: SufE family protein [Rubricoccaceae bacterium]